MDWFEKGIVVKVRLNAKEQKQRTIILIIEYDLLQQALIRHKLKLTFFVFCFCFVVVFNTDAI